MTMTPTASQIEAALDLVENLAANGVRLQRCDQATIEASVTPTPGLRAAIQRNFVAVMAVIDAKAEAHRAIQRARRKRGPRPASGGPATHVSPEARSCNGGAVHKPAGRVRHEDRA